MALTPKTDVLDTHSSPDSAAQTFVESAGNGTEAQVGMNEVEGRLRDEEDGMAQKPGKRQAESGRRFDWQNWGSSRTTKERTGYPTTDFGLVPIPPRLRYHPDNPPWNFGLALNAGFGFASTFVVANLYYCQPLLIQLSESFSTSYSRISTVPTLIQAGYATGLLLISPLGDLVRRRELILLLVILSTSLSIPLCITADIRVFEAFSFLVGMFSVTPQVLLPLAADLSPLESRARNLSVVFAGLLLGVLIARVMAGVIAQFVRWEVVYYFAVGVQCVVLVGAYLLLPDYPAKNQSSAKSQAETKNQDKAQVEAEPASAEGSGTSNGKNSSSKSPQRQPQKLTYFSLLRSMLHYALTEPVLVQACLINMASSASFSCFWVTLTFLLGGVYGEDTLVIGLFGLVGIFGVAMGPFVGHIIDRGVPHPWYASFVACVALVVVQTIQVIANGLSIAAVVIAVLGLDLFRQMLQTSLATSIFSIAPEARARLNAVYILSLFIGQVMGTAAGTKVFVTYGWRACAAVTLGFAGWQILILLLRGPHCPQYTWYGYGEEGLRGALIDGWSHSRRSNRGDSPNTNQGEDMGGEKDVGESRGKGAGNSIGSGGDVDEKRNE